jgi:hypothetical protein
VFFTEEEEEDVHWNKSAVELQGGVIGTVLRLGVDWQKLSLKVWRLFPFYFSSCVEQLNN